MKELNMISKTPKSFEDFVKNAKLEGLEENFKSCIGPSTIPPMPKERWRQIFSAFLYIVILIYKEKLFMTLTLQYLEYVGELFWNIFVLRISLRLPFIFIIWVVIGIGHSWLFIVLLDTNRIYCTRVEKVWQWASSQRINCWKWSFHCCIVWKSVCRVIPGLQLVSWPIIWISAQCINTGRSVVTLRSLQTMEHG